MACPVISKPRAVRYAHIKMIADGPDVALERALMEEFLSDQGLSFQDLSSLEDDQRQRLMVEAEAYAALRLGELAYLGPRGDLLL